MVDHLNAIYFYRATKTDVPGNEDIFISTFRDLMSIYSVELELEKFKPFLSLTGALELIQAASYHKNPYYIIGTLNHSDAIKYSWEELGLNIFDLPLGENQKYFRYIPLNPHVDMLNSLKEIQSSTSTLIPLPTKSLLLSKQWSECYQLLNSLSEQLGHGSRDRMQIDMDSLKKDLVDTKKKLESAAATFAGSPVEDVLTEITKRLLDSKTASNFQSLRNYLNLDSQSVYLSPFSMKTSSQKKAYKKILVVEDNDQVAKHLVQKLSNIYPEASISRLDIDRFIEYKLFYASSGENIILDDNAQQDILFTLDLEIGKSEKTYGLPGGLWLLYHFTLKYPFASRLVITGYRKQNMSVFNSGAGNFLLKPFDDNELQQALNHSHPFHVLWLGSTAAQADWGFWGGNTSNSLDSFHKIVQVLENWLKEYQIGLTHNYELQANEVILASVIVIDCWPILADKTSIHNGFDFFKELYCQIKILNPTANIIIMLPRHDSFFLQSGPIREIFHFIRDGQDSIIHKPLWICGEHSDSLGQRIIKLLHDRPSFDVKYCVFTPLMGLIWPKSKEHITHMISAKKCAKKCIINGWGFFGVLIGEIFGFHVKFTDILNELGYLKDKLLQQLKQERKKNAQRWIYISSEFTSETLVEKFITTITTKENPITPLRSVDKWLEFILDGSPSASGGVARSLTKSLNHLFGGETRFEFGTKGGWYDDQNTFVEDTPIIFEFCAKKGIIAREAINNTIVNYLHNLAGEQVVLIQEIPIRGYLK